MAQPAAAIAGFHRRQVGRDQAGRGIRQNRADEPADPVAPLTGAARFFAGKIVKPLPAMGVDHPERGDLVAQMHENANDDDVLIDVGKTAGVKGVAIIHRAARRCTVSPASPRPRQIGDARSKRAVLSRRAPAA